MINLGLERTSRLLHHIAKTCFGQHTFKPTWKVVHIAGTNGKGSVAAYITSLLQSSKARNTHGQPLKVGRFTSPHFIDRWDCIQIDDRPVSRQSFLATEERVKAIASVVEEELRTEARQKHDDSASPEDPEWESKITEFELLTATAFTLFSESPCDIAVVECGLGGRLDATNVLPDHSIAVSVITRIGLDHLDILGGSLENIVHEKCGIMRPDVQVVVDGDNTPAVLDMIKREHEDKKMKSSLSHVTGESMLYGTSTVVSGLLPHQRTNLAVAKTVFDQLCQVMALRRSDTQHDADTDLSQVISQASASYPGRLQRLAPGWLDSTPGASVERACNKVDVVLDGAHNAQSAEMLVQYIDKATELSEPETSGSRSGTETSQLNLDGTIVYIIALSSKKSAEEILHTLFSRRSLQSTSHGKVHIIFTEFGPVDGMPWISPKDTKELQETAARLGLQSCVVGMTKNIEEALDHVDLLLQSQMSANRPLVIVTGSLYLVGDFLRYQRDGIHMSSP